MFAFVLLASAFISLFFAISIGYFGGYLAASVGVVLFIVFIGGAFKVLRVSAVDSIAKGWVIGGAAEVTNPEKPEYCDAVLDIRALDLGMLVIGSPGSGKSMMAIAIQEFNHTFRPKSGSGYFEGKGDYDIYQAYCSANGAPDFFFSSDLEGSDTINVMDAPPETLIDMLSRVFIAESGNEYYSSAQKKALRSTIPLLKAFGTPVILPDLWALLTNSQAARDLIAKGKSQNIDPDLIAQAEEYFQEDEEDRLNNIGGLLNKMHPYISGQISRKINAYEPTLDIEKAVSEGKHIYFHLPLSETALAVSVMIVEKFGVVAKDRQLDTKNERVPYPLIFDDWGKFFYSNFGPITARCRSAKMPISFYFQSRGQTDAVELGRVFTTEITDNIGASVAMGINGWETATWMAEQFGTYESQDASFREVDQQVSTKQLPRVLPEQLRELDCGEAYLQIYEFGAKGKKMNKRYKLRFPMPSESFPAVDGWPSIQSRSPNDDADGLQLWRDYRSREQIQARKKEAVARALEDKELENDDDDSQELYL